MSTPVVTSKWAGNFDCTVCRRKRLMAEEFSKSSLEKYRKTGQALRCKQCTAKREQEKRAAAAREKADTVKSVTVDDDRDETNEKRTCAGPCHNSLSKDAYNRNQWSKPEGKSRCRECVEIAVKEESKQQNSKKEDKIEDAQKKIANLRLSKTTTAQQIVAAESELAAIEAEKVTGLKPIKLGGRGRGTRRYGGGHGRGGSRGGSGRGAAGRSGRSSRK